MSGRHGMWGTRLYLTWNNMISRCHRIANTHYESYGARGISVCDEWRKDFVVFKDWAVESGYTDKLTIDRIDVNGNYEPKNCRWVTRAQQMGNIRKPKHGTTSIYKGVSWHKEAKRWNVRLQVNGKTKRLGYFHDEVEAAKAYDAAALFVFGEYAHVNFQQVKTAV